MAEIAAGAVYYCWLWRCETCRLRRRCRGRPKASESNGDGEGEGEGEGEGKDEVIGEKRKIGYSIENTRPKHKSPRFNQGRTNKTGTTRYIVAGCRSETDGRESSRWQSTLCM